MNRLRTTLTVMLMAISAYGASVTGKWKVAAQAPDGNTYNVDLIIREEAGKLTGVINSDRGEMPLQDVTAAGDDLTFKLMIDSGPVVFKLKIDGDALKGTLSLADGGSGTVTGKRDGTAAQAAGGADMTGKWKISSKDAEGREMRVTFDLKQAGSKVTGTLILESGDSVEIADGKIDGDQFSCKIPSDEGTFTVTGTVSGTSIKGTYKSPNGSTGSFSGSKG